MHIQNNTVKKDCHQPIIAVNNISFSYEQKPVMQNVSFTVKERDFIGLIGSNGAGKTTLLRILVGLLKPQSGQVELFGEPIQKFKQWEKIGYVPQKNNLNPLFPATVKEVVLSGLGKATKRTAYNQEKCHDALLAMDIVDLANKKIGELSGGQQQRVFLARALINNPALLILDEPTVGIDAETQQSFFHMIKHMHQHHQMTFLMVSHDMDMIRSYLGDEPVSQAGKIKFYIRHSHDTQNCVAEDLAHSLQNLRLRMDREKEV
ncbi:metal ABC transporter ATP-binding protein [Paenibacillus yanchengensis]|uniref:Metal ABC transporter ATP-binding protein n=1 Tax=Paenibacillus yanchengensis TaxID=2035833 RepID=A0ABW4YKD2_9BACL